MITQGLHQCECSVKPKSLIAACNCESQGKERLLLQLMRLGGARCRAGAGGTLDGAKVEPSGFREAFESRQNITCRTHISRFFLHPDDFARVGMLVDGGGNFRARQRVELVQKENCRTSVFTAAAFGTQLVADPSACNHDAARRLPFPVTNPRYGTRVRRVFVF